MKRQRINTIEQVDIVNEYASHLTPMAELADKYAVTRQAVYKILKRAGIDTSKHKIPITCIACGTEVLRTKARIRRQTNHFCSTDCYHTFLQASPYIENRHQSRLARVKVSEFFALRPGHIVHHIDGNQFNNLIKNLIVFANQGDHIRCHRTGESNPIWQGSQEDHPYV